MLYRIRYCVVSQVGAHGKVEGFESRAQIHRSLEVFIQTVWSQFDQRGRMHAPEGVRRWVEAAIYTECGDHRAD